MAGVEGRAIHSPGGSRPTGGGTWTTPAVVDHYLAAAHFRRLRA